MMLISESCGWHLQVPLSQQGMSHSERPLPPSPSPLWAVALWEAVQVLHITRLTPPKVISLFISLGLTFYWFQIHWLGRAPTFLLYLQFILILSNDVMMRQPRKLIASAFEALITSTFFFFFFFQKSKWFLHRLRRWQDYRQDLCLCNNTWKKLNI